MATREGLDAYSLPAEPGSASQRQPNIAVLHKGMLIVMLSMQRSGSTETLDDIARRTGCINLAEPFTFPTRSCIRSGTRDCYLNNTESYLHELAPHASCAALKLFNINFDRSSLREVRALRKLLLSQRVCPIVLERSDILAQYCSLQRAMQTRDWSSHINASTGQRIVQPRCGSVEFKAQVESSTNFVQFYKEHNEWYSFLRSHALAGISRMEITFDATVAQRDRILNSAVAFCKHDARGYRRA